MASRLLIAYLLCFLLHSVLVHGQTANPFTTCRVICSVTNFSVGADICIVETISGFPALIEVTLEELETGLENGQFTSVDLVNVCWQSTLINISQLTTSRPTSREFKKSMALSIVSPRSIRMQSASLLS